MDETHFAALLDIDENLITSWQSLADIIERISNIDLSQLQYNQGASIEDLRASAAENYSIYQSLEDQVRSGKSISNKELETLAPEVQEMFSMMANGTYKMTADAKTFYETVNNLKLDGFQDTLAVMET